MRAAQIGREQNSTDWYRLEKNSTRKSSTDSTEEQNRIKIIVWNRTEWRIEQYRPEGIAKNSTD